MNELEQSLQCAAAVPPVEDAINSSLQSKFCGQSIVSKYLPLVVRLNDDSDDGLLYQPCRSKKTKLGVWKYKCECQKRLVLKKRDNDTIVKTRGDIDGHTCKIVSFREEFYNLKRVAMLNGPQRAVNAFAKATEYAMQDPGYLQVQPADWVFGDNNVITVLEDARRAFRRYKICNQDDGMLGKAVYTCQTCMSTEPEKLLRINLDSGIPVVYGPQNTGHAVTCHAQPISQLTAVEKELFFKNEDMDIFHVILNENWITNARTIRNDSERLFVLDQKNPKLCRVYIKANIFRNGYVCASCLDGPCYAFMNPKNMRVVASHMPHPKGCPLQDFEIAWAEEVARTSNIDRYLLVKSMFRFRLRKSVKSRKPFSAGVGTEKPASKNVGIECIPLTGDNAVEMPDSENDSVVPENHAADRDSNDGLDEIPSRQDDESVNQHDNVSNAESDACPKEKEAKQELFLEDIADVGGAGQEIDPPVDLPRESTEIDDDCTIIRVVLGKPRFDRPTTGKEAEVATSEQKVAQFRNQLFGFFNGEDIDPWTTDFMYKQIWTYVRGIDVANGNGRIFRNGYDLLSFMFFGTNLFDILFMKRIRLIHMDNEGEENVPMMPGDFRALSMALRCNVTYQDFTAKNRHAFDCLYYRAPTLFFRKDNSGYRLHAVVE